jgi:hypothetical protein
VQIQRLAEALIERLELKRNDLLIRAHGIRSDAATLRFTEHGLNFALQCAPEGPPPFRLDLRRARNWLRNHSKSKVVFIDGDRDGSMILSALHAGAATVVTDAIAPARATVDAVAHANDLVLKGRLKPALAPGVPLADVGVVLCSKADDPARRLRKPQRRAAARRSCPAHHGPGARGTNTPFLKPPG